MKNPYLIELPDGAALRLRGGLRRSLQRYGLGAAQSGFGLIQRISYGLAALVGPLQNRLTRQVWRIALEITVGSERFDIDVAHSGAGFVADCFVRVFGPDRFGLLYESMSPVTKKGEILYRLYTVDGNGVTLCSETTLLADPQRHYSYPAFFEVDEIGFGFTVESTDIGRMEIYRSDFNGKLGAPAAITGDFLDPNLVALPDGETWLLFYSTKARPDELVIQPMHRSAAGFKLLGQPLTILDTWLARGGGDVFVAPLETGSLRITRHAQLSLPVYGSHLSRAELDLAAVAEGWKVMALAVDRDFGSGYSLKRRGKGIHTFSYDSAFGLSVTAFDWR